MQSAMNALNPVMTVGQQMRDACMAHSTMSHEEIAERSAEVLRLVSIDPLHLDSYPHQLSGGMRQRAMIAMSLLFTPDLVIMDEPTSALDVVGQRSLMRQVKELQDRLGFAVIFVTHDISLVSHFSDRLMVMYAGQVAELGATSTLFETPRHPYARALLEAYPSIRGEKVALTGIAGSPPNLLSPPAGVPLPAPLCRRDGRVHRRRPADLPGGRVRRPLPALSAGGGGDRKSRRPWLARRATAQPSSRPDRRPFHRPRRLPRSGAAASASQSADDGEAELPLLEVSGLTRTFELRGLRSKKLLHAVDDVSFTIGRREIVALVGESGSGKSTIAQLLAMVYRPTSGDIRFDGKPVGAIKGRRAKLAYRGEVPMVFQDPYTRHQPFVPGLARDQTGDKAAPPGPRCLDPAFRGDPGDGGRGPRAGRGDARQVPLRAERWPTTTNRLRPGARAPPEAHPRRRAGLDARRLHPGRRPQPHGRAAPDARASPSSTSPTTSRRLDTSPIGSSSCTPATSSR